MSKEIYISTTPHETRLAIVEDEQLTEIYYERENEYTLAGSIYNGRVTRVLPGMQSSFVDIGLERDAFLYVTDFMEEQGDAADFETEGGGGRRPAAQQRDAAEGQGDRGRGRRGDRNDRGERRGTAEASSPVTAETASTTSFDEPIAPAPTQDGESADGEGGGSRRWRGRRGRRRGRAFRDGAPATEAGTQDASPADNQEEDLLLEGGFVDDLDASAEGEGISIDLGAQPADVEQVPGGQPAREERGGRRRSRNRRGRKEGRGGEPRGAAEPESVAPSEDEPATRYDNSYAGYYGEEEAPAEGGAVVLPGESIRKYRDPAEVAAEEEEARRNAPPAPEILTVSAPSIEIVGWDGGAVLPGESLGRHRNRQPAGRRTETAAAAATTAEPVLHAAPSVVVPPADSFDQPAPVPASATEADPVVPTPAPTPVPSPEEFPAAEAPEEPSGLTEHPSHGVAVEIAPESGSAQHSEQPVSEAAPVAEESQPVSPAEVEKEYEPAEGESASVSDNARRDLRRFEQPAEPAAATHSETTAEGRAEKSAGESAAEKPAEPEAVAAEPEAVAAEPETIAAEPEPVAQQPDATVYDLTNDAEDAPGSGEAAENSLPELHGEPGNFTALQASGEMLSAPSDELVGEQPAENPGIPPLTEQDTIQPVATVAQERAAQTPSPAEAEPVAVEFTEETDEESGPLELHAYGDGDFHEEEMDDLEGEDFEFAAVGSGLDDESDEYEEETLEDTADLGAVLHEMVVDTHAGEEDDATGGFTAEDFGGEPDEELEERAPLAADAEQRPSRDGGSRRHGGRDRRGGRNSGGDRGRGRRHTMQTTDLPAINELLKPGQEILVQIAKEPIAKKGARITSHIALPGRFLVFMPTVNHTGVSRKISSDEERRRLKSILLSEKGDAQGGFIVRTAADGASEEELRNDLRFLIHLWTDIKARSESSKSPALIYHDLNLVERILRDQVTDKFSAIWVDTEQEYERVLRFLQRFQPSLVRRVKLYTKETPLFEHFGVTQEIDKALKSKVWLKSGGSIVINQTEALVAIDINTGKYVGKTARLEDTILKTNLDAIPEIVRQIRLRDLGGIIVIDFIDMDERKNRAKVMQALEEEMRSDRAPSKILPFNDFGLVIMTRKRVKQSLERTLCIPDPITEGTGMIKSPVTIANEIYIEMRKMHRHFEKQDVLLRVHPEVVKTLKANGGKRLQELEEMTRKTILVKSDPALSPEAFDIH